MCFYLSRKSLRAVEKFNVGIEYTYCLKMIRYIFFCARTKIPGKKNCFLGVIISCVCEQFENVMIEFKDQIAEEKAKIKAAKHSKIKILYMMYALLLDMQ